MTRLSPHFTLEEFTLSQEAIRRGWDNTPPPEAIERLKHTALGLEAVRVRLGAPIIISSGYRTQQVNHAVGGSANSDHLRGDAADFIAPGFGPPAQVCAALRDSGIDYDQLILEFGRWTHISFSPRMRRQALIIDKDGVRPMWT